MVSRVRKIYKIYHNFSNLQIIFLFSCLECLEWDYDKALEEYNNQKVGFYLLFLAKLNYCFIFLA
jgi:hypothetical protein